MSRVILYINNEMVDLPPDVVIASTFQIGDITDIRSRKVSYTKEFKLPLTPTNRRVFQFADDEKSGTNIPYTTLPARLIQNGLEIIPTGTAVIEKCEGAFNIVIFSGPFDFFEAIKNRLISEVDFGEGLITWNAATKASCRKISGNASALLNPFVNYGQVDETALAFNMTYTGVAGGVQLPSVVYHKLIDKIISGAGYTKSGDVFNNADYQTIIIPFSRDSFSFGGSFVKNREFSARKTSSQTVTAASADVTYDVVDKQDGYGMFSKTTGIYDVNVGTVTHSDGREFNFGLFAEITFTVTSGTYRFRLVEAGNPGFPAIVSANYTAGTYTIALGYNDEDHAASLIPGASANYRIECNVVVAGSCAVTAAKFYNKVYGYNYLVTTPQFRVEEILPDISQTDLIRDFAIRFGVMFYEQNKILYAKYIKDIINDKTTARDWTAKRDVRKPDTLLYALDNYAQKNNFTYASTDDSYQEGQGDGFFSIANENIDEENPFHDSIFNGSATLKVVNTAPAEIMAAYIPIWDTLPTDWQTAFDTQPGLRILATRSKYSSEPTVNYNGVAESDYLIAYFMDANTPFQMDWQYAINQNYKQLVDSLDKAKVIKRFYRLTDLDIAILDLVKLVFDNGSYYMINKVENYVPGKSTGVQLFKVI
jgi:hypothetical protein